MHTNTNILKNKFINKLKLLRSVLFIPAFDVNLFVTEKFMFCLFKVIRFYYVIKIKG